MNGYYARREAGLCPRCGEPIDGEYVLCPGCREKCRLWAQQYGEGARTRKLEGMKRQYQERKDKGLCPRCGAPQDEEKYVMCKKCRTFNAAAQRKFRSIKSSKETNK